MSSNSVTVITLEGSFKITPVNGGLIKTAKGAPPPGLSGGVSPNINLTSEIVEWKNIQGIAVNESDNTVPPEISNKTLKELFSIFPSNSTDYTFKANFAIEGGVQGTEDQPQRGGEPVMIIGLYKNAPPPPGVPPGSGGAFNLLFPRITIAALTPTGDIDKSFSIPYCLRSTGRCPTPIPVVLNRSQIESASLVNLIPWNPCPTTAEDCDNEDARNIIFSITVDIKIVVRCGGNDLNSGFCFKFCQSNPDRYTTCRPAYISHCFGTNPIIATNDSCFNFFGNYISEGPGPSNDIDIALGEYCQAKFTDLNDYLENTNISTRDGQLCACNLQQTEYEKLRASLFSEFTNYNKADTEGGLDIIAPCLLSACTDSKFKTTVTKDPCPVPACVNITGISAGGSIEGPVVVNQSAQCKQLTAKVSSGRGGGKGSGVAAPGTGTVSSRTTVNDSWWSRNKDWVIALLILIIVIILIIIMVIIFSSGSKPKKPQDNIPLLDSSSPLNDSLLSKDDTSLLNYDDISPSN